jgi:phosphatidylserine/phosphatidylglycerophosphate/cardiolipin synthase-like enzyme
MTRAKKQLNQLITVALVITFIGLFVYYFFTGSDPLGLFTESATMAVVQPVSGDWWSVYFTEPADFEDPDDLSNTVAEPLITAINAAQETIHIAAFEFNLTPVAEALIAAHRRGVEVQWVTDDEYGLDADIFEEDHGQFAMLEDAGIEVRGDDRGALMHNKFWIFDGRTVWTGSTNMTVNGIFRNNNNVIVIESPEVAAMYEREFAEMWDGEFGPTSPSTVDSQAVTVGDTPIRVLFSAEDEVGGHLADLIAEAERSIRFMAFSFTHEAMGQAVLARANAGVDVRGIFEVRGSETEYSELTPLYCASVDVRQDGNPRTFHHKVFIIDERIVVTGSFNFSANADDSNDENVVIIENDEIASHYLQEFERRWAEAIPPEAGDLDCP